jgi:hypothetical protein
MATRGSETRKLRVHKFEDGVVFRRAANGVRKSQSFGSVGIAILGPSVFTAVAGAQRLVASLSWYGAIGK